MKESLVTEENEECLISLQFEFIEKMNQEQIRKLEKILGKHQHQEDIQENNLEKLQLELEQQ